MIKDMERIWGALEVVEAEVAGQSRDDVRWGIAWQLAMSRIDARAVLRSCREIRFEGSEAQKREAAVVARLVKRGRAYASLVDEIERGLRDLYPANSARRRLDELGWEPVSGESIQRSLDRSCMVARVNAPPYERLRAKVHAIARGRFADLEFANQLQEGG